MADIFNMEKLEFFLVKNIECVGTTELVIVKVL